MLEKIDFDKSLKEYAFENYRKYMLRVLSGYGYKYYDIIKQTNYEKGTLYKIIKKNLIIMEILQLI